MTEKSSIYTRSGDQGETALLGGDSVSKADARVDLYGELEELNSWLGVIVSCLETNDKDFRSEIEDLEKLQKSIFILSANLACIKAKREKYNLSQLSKNDITRLEEWMDKTDATLPRLNNFIFPGGDVISSYLHVSRSVCRRVERKMSAMAPSQSEYLPYLSQPFINRVSDYLFVLARHINFKLGIKDKYWTSEKK